MRLIIAEKPSLGRAIAAVLPRPHQKGEGYIKSADGDVVSWCIGHLLEQAEPDGYDPQFKTWRLEHLPIIPDPWQLQPKPKTRKQLSVLKSLIKQASSLVHAGDPDREGQLLVDEVIDYLKVDSAKRHSMQRLLVSDLNPAAVKRSLQQLRPNSEFKHLSISALARSRADWLYGINQTRAWTIQTQQAGDKSSSGRPGVVSIGRVQTPVLGLVVERDQEIEQFVSHDYFQVEAAIHLDQLQPHCFSARWQPSQACQQHQDAAGRVINPKLAENVASRIRQQPATVDEIQQKHNKIAPPLPYNLSKLQIDAAKRFSLPAKRVLDICQLLYEKHQLITYPRSDCQFLPKDHHRQASSVIDAIFSMSPELQSLQKNIKIEQKSRAWNDKKVTAHHAIIPTQKISKVSLNRDERNIYKLISERYLMQFMADYQYAMTTVSLIIGGGSFVKKFKQLICLGWRECLALGKPSDIQEKVSGYSKDQTQTEDDCIALPPLSKGQVLWSGEPYVLHKQTEPPEGFTDASLLAAMTGISRFISNPELKSILKETDGLGTEATRAGIIELLFKRGFLQRNNKRISATAMGRSLINVLPIACTKPDMTAHWERQLSAIQSGHLSYQAFIQPLIADVNQLIAQAREVDQKRLIELRQNVVEVSPNKSRRRQSTGQGRGGSSSRRSPRSKASYRKPAK